MTTLYIAGPMSGMPDLNFPAFHHAELQLREAGYDVVNPASFGYADVDKHTNPGAYKEAVGKGIQAAIAADGVALLPNWPRSDGAGHEVRAATAAGKPTMSVHNWIVEARDREAKELRYVGDRQFEPAKVYAGDAGYDLFVAGSYRIHVGDFMDVDCGISVQLPEGTWGLITGRSSTVRRRGLLVVNGVIDNGYRGPLFAACQNLSEDVVCLEKGERIAQLILFPIIQAPIVRVRELSESDRGSNAFGSSGA